MNHKEATEDIAEKKSVKNDNHLVLYNDDVNTFDFVIASLMEICKHEREQAEQCSIIVHNNGRCQVKDGSTRMLKPMCRALVQRGLTAEVE